MLQYITGFFVLNNWIIHPVAVYCSFYFITYSKTVIDEFEISQKHLFPKKKKKNMITNKTEIAIDELYHNIMLRNSRTCTETAGEFRVDIVNLSRPKVFLK